MSEMFQKLRNGGQQPVQNQQQNAGQQPNFNQMFQQFQQNPAQYLSQGKLDIPQNLQGNPQGMLQHLVNSGQVSQQQLAKAQQMANALMRFMPR